MRERRLRAACPAIDAGVVSAAMVIAEMDDSDHTAASALTPRQRWGTCCPHDPECEHSYLDDVDLTLWLDSPLADDDAAEFDTGAHDESR